MKIAICVSGQTRRHAEYKEKWQAGIDSLFGDYSYDLFGHTWSDQTPPTNLDKFKDFSVDDQHMMAKWMEKDPFHRMYHNSAWFNEDEYHGMLKDGDWYEHAIGATKRAYGQFWSAILCYNQVPNDYDIVVRYRWDIGVSKSALPVKQAIQDFITAQQQGSHSSPGQIQKDIEPLIGTDVLVSTPYRKDYIADLFFVSNNNILKAKEKPIAYWMDQMMAIRYPDKPVAHIGWASLLEALDLKVVSAMPHVHYDLDDFRVNSANASGNNYFPKDEF